VAAGIFYAVIPRILPPTAYRALPQGNALEGIPVLSETGIRVSLPTSIRAISALLTWLILMISIYYLNRKATFFNLEAYALTSCALLVTFGHLMPGTPTAVSKVGECSYICLLTHWMLLCARPTITVFPVSFFGHLRLLMGKDSVPAPLHDLLYSCALMLCAVLLLVHPPSHSHSVHTSILMMYPCVYVCV
jgi:hypothetical protein